VAVLPKRNDQPATSTGRPLRSALTGLTTRGRCLLAAGVTCSLSALIVGELDLLRVGVLLIALPLIAVAVVARTRYRLSCGRTVRPHRLTAGGDAQVELCLENVSRLPTSVLLLEDSVPYQLGVRPRFVVDRVESGGRRTVHYPLTAPGRGRYRIGPLSVRLTDPFGFCELTRSFTASDELLVTPTVWQLPPSRLGGDWTGGGDGRSASVAASGEDDVATREYHLGDDLRRVHWRATARTGELMVRREEQPWQSRATVLLDVRSDAHAGSGTMPVASSFEWAVAAAASISIHLARTGFALRLLHGAVNTNVGGAVVGQFGGSAEALAMADLATVTLGGESTLAEAIGQLSVTRTGTLVAILGRLDADQARLLSRVRLGPGAKAMALLLDTGSWTRLSPRARIAADNDLGAARDLLAVAGWRVAIVERTSSLSEVWSSVGSASPFEGVAR
jgi:uncharacterized protein (DUF58 family)